MCTTWRTSEIFEAKPHLVALNSFLVQAVCDNLDNASPLRGVVCPAGGYRLVAPVNASTGFMTS